ncbi:substrate-binding periplasmic protein [Aurantibacillus circumpalustris]|uniref:substrate-binding periplasmic protein n=1 Tax=Aurantibacillus circumpalustris TaxID=3036359 RepID=UPI00295BB4B0|nr:transporter substrate-binding domain-containing protein [Aurantibacillus circumpalustris]
MRYFLIIITSVLSSISFAQIGDTLFVNYYIQTPFAYTDNGSVKGIEVDIVNEYVYWLKSKKKINITLKQVGYTDFNSFYISTKKSQNSLGLGSVTISQERAMEVDFSSAYLKNVAFCVTNGHAPDVKSKTTDEILRSLGSMSALTINNTSLNRYIVELKKQYIQDLKISYKTDEVKILDEIAKNVLCFGYVDAVGFWFYLKNNPGKFLKMQKILNQSKEELGFVMPKGSQHKALFNEFFASFKSTPAYRSILEKYLGAYMTQNMAIN